MYCGIIGFVEGRFEGTNDSGIRFPFSSTIAIMQENKWAISEVIIHEFELCSVS